MIAAEQTLEGGFDKPILDSQAVFRTVMEAMAHPGQSERIEPLTAPPAPLTPLMGALVCTLVDADTPLWLDPAAAESKAVREWIAFHAGAPLARTPGEAAFAVVTDCARLPLLADFAQGTDEYPDRSTTLMLQLHGLDGGAPLTLAGPGIEKRTIFAPRGLPQDFAAQWRENVKRFPCGVDLVLTAGDALACLPRSTRLTKTEG